MLADDPVLGAIIANFPSDRGRPLLIGGAVCAAAAVLLNFTLAANGTWWGQAITVIVMAALALGVGWYLLHIWNREIVLYERGFSYREGSNTIFFLYAEVKSLRQRAEQLAYFWGLFRRIVYTITVITTSNETLVIHNFYKRMDELGARLEKQVNEALRPSVMRRLSVGETVAFADTLRLDGLGLHVDGQRIGWEAFGGYTIQNRQLQLLDRNGAVAAAIPLADLENVTLLLDILREQKSLYFKT